MDVLYEHLDIYLENEVYMVHWTLFFVYMIKDLLNQQEEIKKVLAISGLWCQFGKRGIFLLFDVFPLNTGMNFI